MPALISGVASRYAETRLVDASGKGLIILEENLPLTVTDAQIAAYQDAMGNLSNAAIFKQVAGNKTESAIEDVTAFDEAESSVNKGANLIFQSLSTLEQRSFRVPAIDADAIEYTGRFLKSRSHPQVDALIVAILDMLGVDWIYSGSTISTVASSGDIETDEIYVPEPEESDDMELYETSFTFSSAYPLLLVTVPALATITSIRLHIDEEFNVPTTIRVGDSDVPDRLMSSDQNNPLEIGVYEVEPDFEYSDVTTLVLLIDAPGADTGEGRVLITYDKD